MKLIAGIDGSKGGWVSVSANVNNNQDPEFNIYENFKDISRKDLELILVDMPIGLEKELFQGGRVVDREARRALIKGKSSIFNSPSRLALKAKDYQEANEINKSQGMGLSKQSWFLFKKIKEVDDFLKLQNRPQVFESHPELVFQTMKGGEIEFKKSTREGLAERIGLLLMHGFNEKFINQFIGKKSKLYKDDDFLDACSLLWSARRVKQNKEIKIPNEIFKDEKGVIMQMKI
jgi:predicted RNase H-like nuclease